jgi:hypothetical protein
MIKKKIIFFILSIFFITSCADSWDSVKRGIAGKKAKTGDEFLVQKKDPLILPPDFDKLPRIHHLFLPFFQQYLF